MWPRLPQGAQLLQSSAGYPRAPIQEAVPCPSLSLPPSSLHWSLVVPSLCGWAVLWAFDPMLHTTILQDILLASFVMEPVCGVSECPQTTPLACLGPSPSPGCSSPAHPGWLPAFPQLSPQVLTLRHMLFSCVCLWACWICVSACGCTNLCKIPHRCA